MGPAIQAGRAFIKLSLKDVTAAGFKAASGRLRTFSRAAGSLFTLLGKITAAAIAASAAIGGIFVVGAIKMAGDMVETMNAFNATFGESAPATEAWGRMFSKVIGRSRQETMKALTRFQAFSVGLGMTEKQATATSKKLLLLTTDLASFQNITDEKALQQVMSMLAGEPEAVRRYGIVVSEARTNKMLEEQGLPRVQEGATELQKMFVRGMIALETLGKQGALGDAVKTSGEFVNQLKRIRASMQEVLIQFGEKLIPLSTEFLNQINTRMPLVIDMFNQASDVVVGWAESFFRNQGGIDGFFDSIAMGIDAIVNFYIPAIKNAFLLFGKIAGKVLEGIGADFAPLRETIATFGKAMSDALLFFEDPELMEQKIADLMTGAVGKVASGAFYSMTPTNWDSSPEMPWMQGTTGYGAFSVPQDDPGTEINEATEYKIRELAKGITELEDLSDGFWSGVRAKDAFLRQMPTTNRGRKKYIEHYKKVLRELQGREPEEAAEEGANEFVDKLRERQDGWNRRLAAEEEYLKATAWQFIPDKEPFFPAEDLVEKEEEKKKEDQFTTLTDTLGSAGAFRSGAAVRLGHNMQGGIKEITGKIDEEIAVLKRIDNRIAATGGLGA